MTSNKKSQNSEEESAKIKRIFDIILRQLSIQSSLLLGFRAIFLTINTILLPVVFHSIRNIEVTNNYAAPILISLLGFIICCAWYFATELKRYDVFYLQTILIILDNCTNKKVKLPGEPNVIKLVDFNVQEALINWQSKDNCYKHNALKEIDEGKKVLCCRGRRLLNAIRNLFIIVWFCLLIYIPYQLIDILPTINCSLYENPTPTKSKPKIVTPVIPAQSDNNTVLPTKILIDEICDDLTSVREMQKFLEEIEVSPGAIDGECGGKTYNALRKYQKIIQNTQNHDKAKHYQQITNIPD